MGSLVSDNLVPSQKESTDTDWEYMKHKLKEATKVAMEVITVIMGPKVEKLMLKAMKIQVAENPLDGLTLEMVNQFLAARQDGILDAVGDKLAVLKADAKASQGSEKGSHHLRERIQYIV